MFSARSKSDIRSGYRLRRRCSSPIGVKFVSSQTLVRNRLSPSAQTGRLRSARLLISNPVGLHPSSAVADRRGRLLDRGRGSHRRRYGDRGRVCLAAMAALVAVALDLARQLVDHQVQRMQHLRRGVARPQRDTLEVERRLRHIAVGDARLWLPEYLELQAGELGDLAGNLL